MITTLRPVIHFVSPVIYIFQLTVEVLNLKLQRSMNKLPGKTVKTSGGENRNNNVNTENVKI